jgi:HD-GYP domain-containing protein (c-di-GMP phosphodiesterase class II)
VFFRKEFTPDIDWVNYMETLAGQAAIAIEQVQLFDGLQHTNHELIQAYNETIEGWVRALDLRDEETEGHSLRVTQLCLDLSVALGIQGDELTHIRRGALLHDIGKVGVPDNVLLKPGKLTDEEWVIMRKHPQFAFDMLFPIEYLRPALSIPYSHHEKWDGTGYPDQLKGEEIPFAARIFSVVDVWDVLSSDRPYRKAWAKSEVLKYIKDQAGIQFDPKVIEVFLQIIQ